MSSLHIYVAIKPKELQTFQVKLKDDIKSAPTVTITDTCGLEVAPVKLTKISPNTYQADFTPSDLGPLIISATAEGKPVEGSPAHVSVVEHPENIDKIKVEGLAPGFYI